jgi:Rrf2 family protein
MMIYIARQGKGKIVTIKDIAESEKISMKYLEQIVSYLTKAKLLKSVRGPQGGYMLTARPESYTAGDIIRAIEGSLAPIACLDGNANTCERKKFCPTLPFWKGLYNTIDSYVDSVTLKDFIK